ncbi:hypothetical protein KGF54_001366 [Candida jiufengensis]|uniref:uncharacterized protein n=1 Tax=Candida jiufengensis TaxID=497108 RepID=UPI002224E055|nr:uncharacterized protein KGF54_001366 [Candida jiufengensis]KAI5955864.1 hypothetical protein KGF54_001366 [Candida jiufengensis]
MDGLLKKVKALTKNVDQKDLKDAYDTYNKTGGSLDKKGKAVYQNYNKSHSASDATKTDAKTDARTDAKTDSKTESNTETKTESK